MMKSNLSSNLNHLRADFDKQAGKSLALPAAGAIVWAAVGVAALFLSPRIATFAMIIGTGLIFPIGILLASLLRENLFTNTNPLAKLMAMCVLMVNLLWAVHISLLFVEPTLIPLTLGISLGLHWIVFSWIIGHPVGTVHAVARTALVTIAWWLFPGYAVSAVAAAVVISYIYSVVVLRRRPPNIANNSPAA